MSPKLVFTIALLATLVASACDDEESGPSAETPTPGSTSPPMNVEFETLDRGSYSGIILDDGPLLEKIQTQAQWQDFWERHQQSVSPPPEPPAFDFGDRVLLALVDGSHPTGGYSIEITDIVPSETGVTVHALRTVPDRGCIVTQAFTQPFHIVATETFTAHAELQVTEVVIEC